MAILSIKTEKKLNFSYMICCKWIFSTRNNFYKNDPIRLSVRFKKKQFWECNHLIFEVDFFKLKKNYLYASTFLPAFTNLLPDQISKAILRYDSLLSHVPLHLFLAYITAKLKTVNLVSVDGILKIFFEEKKMTLDDSRVENF